MLSLALIVFAFFVVFGSIAIRPDVIESWVGVGTDLHRAAAPRQRPAVLGGGVPLRLRRPLLHRPGRHRPELPARVLHPDRGRPAAGDRRAQGLRRPALTPRLRPARRGRPAPGRGAARAAASPGPASAAPVTTTPGYAASSLAGSPHHAGATSPDGRTADERRPHGIPPVRVEAAEPQPGTGDALRAVEDHVREDRPRPVRRDAPRARGPARRTRPSARRHRRAAGPRCCLKKSSQGRSSASSCSLAAARSHSMPR